MIGPSEALVFVNDDLKSGPILIANPQFRLEVTSSGCDISEHSIPEPKEPGLQIFEGWVEVGSGDDPDVYWVGDWRRLTHWEMCRVRHGMPPQPSMRQDEAPVL